MLVLYYLFLWYTNKPKIMGNWECPLTFVLEKNLWKNNSVQSSFRCSLNCFKMKTRKCKVKFLGAAITPVQWYQLIFNLVAFTFIIWFGQEIFGKFYILKVFYCCTYVSMIIDHFIYPLLWCSNSTSPQLELSDLHLVFLQSNILFWTEFRYKLIWWWYL